MTAAASSSRLERLRSWVRGRRDEISLKGQTGVLHERLQALNHCLWPYAVLALLAVPPAMSAWSMGPDPLIDFGRELYVPWRLSEGATLYRDLAYFNGPLSPYVNAAWFALLGTSLKTLLWANVVVFAATTAVAFHLFERLANRRVALVAAAMLPLVFGFGNYTTVPNYNFLTPYSHEMTHGLLAGLLTLLATFRIREGKRAPALFAGVGLGATLLTKPELAVATTAGVAAYLAAYGHTQRLSWRTAGGLVAAIAVGALVVIVTTVAAMSSQTPWDEAFASCFGAWRMAASPEIRALDFYRRCLGTYDLTASVESIAVSATVGIGALGLSQLIDRVLPAAARIAAGFAAGLAMFCFAWAARLDWTLVERALPLALIALVLRFGWRVWRRTERSPGDLAAYTARLAWCVFALALVAKMALFCRATHYGFVLALPAVATAPLALFDWLPRRGTRMKATSLPWLAMPLVAGYILYYQTLQNQHAAPELTCGLRPNDRFLASAAAAGAQYAAEVIERRTARGETVAVLPEGVMLNYLTRRTSTTKYFAWLPPEVIHFGEKAMQDDLAARPPNWILLAPCHLDEYGRQPFGKGYCDPTAAWIDANYEPVESWDDGQWKLLRAKSETDAKRE